MFIYSPNQNQHLFDVAYAMFMRGEGSDTVLREICIENTWCRPPLSASEVNGIVANARKWVGGDQDDPAFAALLERIRFAHLQPR
jgi:hypothetical protein